MDSVLIMFAINGETALLVSFSEVYDKLLNGNISFHITHIIKIVTASSSSIACLQ